MVGWVGLLVVVVVGGGGVCVCADDSLGETCLTELSMLWRRVWMASGVLVAEGIPIKLQE